jgi:hypothetical protein
MKASLLSNYKLKIPNSKFKNRNDAVLSKITIDDCAKQCNEHVGFECKSFDFCYINGDCTLSQKEAPEITDSINTDNNEYIQTENCDIYESKLLI